MLFALREELDVISSMQVIDREVFYYLAARTNLDSGFVGKVIKVSYGGMALDLSERVSSGRRKSLFVVSSTDVRHSVERLVTQGVFARASEVGKGKPLLLVRVFYVEFMAQNRSVKNELSICLVDRLVLDKRDIFNGNNALQEDSMQDCHGESREVGRTIFQHQQQADFEEKFTMSLDWQPSEPDLKMILFRAFGAKHKIADIDPVWVGEFVAHWYSQQDRQHTQREWTVRLGARLVDYFRRPGHFDNLRGVRGGAGVGKTHVEKSSHVLPDWAKPPKDDAALIAWMRAHGYGDAPRGFGYQETRGWLRRKIDERVAASHLPKIAH